MDNPLILEGVAHGRAGFPLQVYPGFINPASPISRRGGFDSHWHQEMEILVCGKDGGRLTVDGVAMTVPPEALCFVHPGELHAWTSPPKSAQSTAIVFDWSLLVASPNEGQGLLPSLASGDLRFPRLLRAGSKAAHRQARRLLLRLIQTHQQDSPGMEAAVKGSLYHLAALLADQGLFKKEQSAESGRAARRTEKIKRTLEFIHRQFAQDLDIAAMADAAHLSPFHFCRLFKQATHWTPKEYLLRYRVRRAAMLLRTTEMSVTEVAQAVGFGHLSYFIRSFKKIAGHTPRQFRAQDDAS